MFHIVQQKNIIRISCLARQAIMSKRNLGLRFFFFFNFLFIFSLNLKFPKRAAELRIRLDSEISAAPYGPDCLCPEGTAGSAAPFPEGSPCPAQGRSSPHGPSSCPSDAGAGLVFSTPQPCYSSSGQITIKCFECLSDSKKILLC